MLLNKVVTCIVVPLNRAGDLTIVLHKVLDLVMDSNIMSLSNSLFYSYFVLRL